VLFKYLDLLRMAVFQKCEIGCSQMMDRFLF